MKKDLKNIKYLLLFIIIFGITFCYTFFCFQLTGDEVWNYGFAYSIFSGLVPYRDFNMIIPPLYSFIGSIFIFVFGNYLYSLHILDAILVGIMMFMLFKMIGFKSFIIYPFIVFWAIPSYNLLCLFLLFVILYLIYEKKDNDSLFGIIIGLLFLTKQTVGGCLFIPLFLYSKNKLKCIISFLIPVVLLIIYLFCNNALYQFIDYCFLGMFDFGNKNTSFSIFSVFEFIIFIILITKLIISRGKDKELAYILAFQIVVFPIMDLYHFFISISSVIYYFIKRCKSIKLCFIISGIILLVVYCYLSVLFENGVKFSDNNNFMYMRANWEDNDLVDLEEQIKFVASYYEGETFLFVRNAYLFKILFDKPINKFDIINNGNMGYDGENRYISELESICSTRNCIFIVDISLFHSKIERVQMNQAILEYVFSNYDKIDEFEKLVIYSN